jgi:hypothetical protein
LGINQRWKMARVKQLKYRINYVLKLKSGLTDNALRLEVGALELTGDALSLTDGALRLQVGR